MKDASLMINQLNKVLSTIDIEQYQQARWNSILKYSIFTSRIRTTESGRHLLELLNKQDGLACFDDILMNTGYGAGRVSRENVAYWLLWRAISTSPQQAMLELDEYLKAASNDGLEILAISGIEYSTAEELYDGVVLTPLTDLPSSVFRDELDEKARLLPPMSYRVPYVPTVLVRQTQFHPKFLTDDAIHGPSLMEGLDSQLLYDVCLCFTLVGDACPIPVAHWSQLRDSVPCAQFAGSGGSRSVYDVEHVKNHVLTDEELNRIRELIPTYFRLSEKERKFYRLVIERLNQAKRRLSLPDKALDLGISLEMLLLRGADDKQQLSLTFRLRGAWLLGKNVDERYEHFTLLKKLYDYRSSVAHSGDLNSKNEKKRVQIEQDLSAGIQLAALLIIRSMELGSLTNSHWDKILLGIEKFSPS